ncbi:cation:proton antiporter [Candidatus Woesearchaeota archaeon]|nr:cation:proton antiporter [Candidatus Woesearchaeota archaeon]
MASLDPQLISFVIIVFVALFIGAILRIMKQPSVIAYIITGLILGPFGFGLIKDTNLISNLGNFGVVLLLFFAGMEMSLSKLISKWRIAILGTIFQILISVGVVYVLGYFLDWTFGRILLIGFVISLSSTAVVLKILDMKNETKTQTGQEAISILLVQDVAIIPMIMLVSVMGGDGIDYHILTLQLIGSILAIAFVIWMVRKNEIKLPFGEKFKGDSELQVLAAFVICFGIALISGLFQLSTALGAFIAGLFLSCAKETEWVHHSLQSFKVLFLALFFISIGMLIDMRFLFKNVIPLTILLLLVFFVNTLINALIFRWNGSSWRQSLYGGSILSQIGEFSFILAAIGLGVNLITDFGYQMTMALIALSLMISPFWIRFFSIFVEESDRFIKKQGIKIKV